MSYETYQQELIRRWRGLEVPVDEAIDALRAALYLDLERVETEKTRILSESDAGQPLPTEALYCYRRSAKIHFTLGYLDEIVESFYGLGMTHPHEFLQGKMQISLFD